MNKYERYCLFELPFRFNLEKMIGESACILRLHPYNFALQKCSAIDNYSPGNHTNYSLRGKVRPNSITIRG